MANSTNLDLSRSLRDILVMIGFPPEPTALLERVEGRMDDADIAGLVAVVKDQGRALKAAEAAINQLFTHLSAPVVTEALAEDDGEEEESAALPETVDLEPDESIVADLVERMKPRLDDPGIKELVLALELQAQSLRRANKRIAELAR